MKTFADFKRKIKEAKSITMQHHQTRRIGTDEHGKPIYGIDGTPEPRKLVSVMSNAFRFTRPDGKDTYCQFGKAKDWAFTQDTATYHEDGKPLLTYTITQ